MMIRTVLLSTAKVCTLVACQAARPDGAVCGASQFQHLVGNPLPPGLNIPDNSRYYGADEPVATDNPRRLNLQVSTPSIVDAIGNPSATVTRVFCG